MNNIFELLENQETSYTTETVKIGKYVDYSMYDTLQTIDAYLNSKHTSGSTDSLGREKPFFNIVIAAANIWFRATDIDRKDISAYASNSHEVTTTFIANVLLQNWMIRENFGVFLNDWGRCLSKYGSSVVKFVKKDGRLIPSVVNWNNLIVDPVDFSSMPVIEKVYLTPYQLKKNKFYKKDVVADLIKAKQTRENLDGQGIDTREEFIEVYEIHGELPLSFITGKDADDEEFVQQMHVVSYCVGKEKKEFFELYKGRETKSPYLLTHLIPEPDRTLSIGAVEMLINAQWMINHNIKAQRDYLDLASKLVFQTADSTFKGRNILNSLEQGEIFVHAQNSPMTQVNNSAMNLSAMQSFFVEWQQLSREMTSTPDALRGNTMPPGTAYSLGAILQQQASSLFELMTENKGLYLEEMMREFILPHIKTQMDTTEEVSAILEDYNIKQIDEMYIPNEAVRVFNKQTIKTILTGGVPSPYQKEIFEGEVKNSFSPLGNQRFFKPSEISTKSWKEALKDFEWKIKVEITNEMRDKQTALATLSSVLQSIASNPMVLNDPNAKLVFSKILNLTGAVSPIELNSNTNMPVAPIDGRVGAGNRLQTMMT